MTVITRFHEFGDQDGSGGKADREALLASGEPQAERDVCLASAAVINEPMTAVVCSIGPNSTPSRPGIARAFKLVRYCTRRISGPRLPAAADFSPSGWLKRLFMYPSWSCITLWLPLPVSGKLRLEDLGSGQAELR